MDPRWDTIIEAVRESDIDLDYLGSTMLVLRKLRGLSEEELAKRAGISPGELETLEEGTRWPDAGELRALLDALGIDAVRFLFSLEEVRLMDEILSRSKVVSAGHPSLSLGEGLRLPRGANDGKDEPS